MTPFKSCPKCKSVWKTRDEFLDSKELVVLGYQAAPDHPTQGLYLFDHDAPGCHTSLSLKVALFADLFQGTPHPTSQFGTENCEGLCLRSDELRACHTPCSNAFAREILRALIARLRIR